MFDPVSALLFGAGNALFSGGLTGSRSGSTSGGTTRSRFDRSQLPLFGQTLQDADAASQRLGSALRQMGGQRTQALRRDLDSQREAVEGLGAQEIADLNQRFDARAGGIGQRLASRGLYNSTVAPGMRALLERERGAALGRARERQQRYLGGLLGQRAQLLDQVRSAQNAGLSQLGFQDYQLRTLLPKAIASSRASTRDNQSTSRQGGLLSGLFG